jgi:hypothetical protein
MVRDFEKEERPLSIRLWADTCWRADLRYFFMAAAFLAWAASPVVIYVSISRLVRIPSRSELPRRTAKNVPSRRRLTSTTALHVTSGKISLTGSRSRRFKCPRHMEPNVANVASRAWSVKAIWSFFSLCFCYRPRARVATFATSPAPQ